METQFDEDTFLQFQKVFSASAVHLLSQQDAALFTIPEVPKTLHSSSGNLIDQSARIFGMLAFLCLFLWGSLFYYFDSK